MTALSTATAAADTALAGIAADFSFLADVTPVNAEAAWQRFRDADGGEQPQFEYAAPSADIAMLQTRLRAVPSEAIDDPALAGLLEAQRHELSLRLAIVAERDTPAVLDYSRQLWGDVDEALLGLAEGVLDALADASRADPATFVGAGVLAEAARHELARYRRRSPGLDGAVEIRDDVSGVLVAKNRLWIDRTYRLDPARVDALVQHEVGTHLVTYENGRRQPLALLADGLAGYEQTQEGLAVLAEHAVAGLTPDRMRLLAARVLAARARQHGATFAETFAWLVERTGLADRGCFDVAMRIYRAGGLTKDLVYLRGLNALVGHFGARGTSGGDLEPLLVGKIPLRAVPPVRELLDRGVLRPPAIRPRWLDVPGAQARLSGTGPDGDVVDLATWLKGEAAR